MPSLVTLIDQIFDILVLVAILDLFNDLTGMIIGVFNNLLDTLITEKVFGSLLDSRILFVDKLDNRLGVEFDIHAVEDRDVV